MTTPRFVLGCVICSPVFAVAILIGGIPGILFAAIFLTFLVALWESDRHR